ncbi:carboxylating nicotinate-nucleotide diphosphorylase [Sphingomonas turrisvirgatae]|uniref:Probable nicotinate-nucleotide pyrophosphorylase [carboxylating] n=1 Tax=Sphingomonas turrisvirgatae TaxID=1888892 RepID=A0A1E3LWH7_9SPHN|nr:carboxylating nicotinate-nucleotide diphosphorylase [Sphingomonas turrisvirgatae]ODP38132.1 nicotinate-nucleotide diphosphorylase (carboxylating) [Sphingomonas turrisvirgatae]
MSEAPPALIAGFDERRFVADLLAEDLGPGGDITSAATLPPGATLAATMASRDSAVVAGLALAATIFRAVDPLLTIDVLVADGALVPPGTALMRISGPAGGLLAGERSALNLVQHLSGVATLTRAYVDQIAGTGCVLLDTRKTLPGLRLLEKYAVRIGGGQNHRMRLDEAVLIKDNHIAGAGGVTEAVAAARRGGHDRIQVEVDTIDQIAPALEGGATMLLLDNFDLEALRVAVGLVAGRVPLEASGGVRLDTIRAIAETGVDFVSVGRITQSAPAIDIGLDVATLGRDWIPRHGRCRATVPLGAGGGQTP